MSFLTNKNFSWFEKAFGRKQREGIDGTLPNLVSSDIAPTVDALGWAHYDRIESEAASANNVDTRAMVVLPLSEQAFLVFAASARHGDGAANHTLWIDYMNNRVTGSAPVALIPPVNVPAQHPVALNRPVLLPRGTVLRARSLNLTGAGNFLQIEVQFLRLAIGEYVPSV